MNYKTICLILSIITLYLLFIARSKQPYLTPPDTLPEQVAQRIEITPGQIKTYTREQDMVKVTEKYHPPEGKITIESDLSGVVSVKADNHALTLKPHVIASFDENLAIGVGARIFYWDRFGLGPGVLFKNEPEGTKIQPYIMADMRLAGIIKWMENSSVGVYYNFGQNSLGFAVGVYF